MNQQNGTRVKKPLTVARHDFIEAMTSVINSSGLPLFVIEDILKDTYNKITLLSSKQLEQDMQEYKRALEEATVHPIRCAEAPETENKT